MGDISKNFSRKEFEKNGNTIPETLFPNVQKLVVNVLQPIRDRISAPIVINSGYRSPEYNKKINGSLKSQHMEGKAADITADCNLYALFLNIKENLVYDQLIYEFKLGEHWIHVSYNEGKNRLQAMTAVWNEKREIFEYKIV